MLSGVQPPYFYMDIAYHSCCCMPRAIDGSIDRSSMQQQQQQQQHAAMHAAPQCATYSRHVQQQQHNQAATSQPCCKLLAAPAAAVDIRAASVASSLRAGCSEVTHQ